MGDNEYGYCDSCGAETDVDGVAIPYKAEIERLKKALRRIARPPYQWDTPETRDTNEVRLRCHIARAALTQEEE